ncbi:hypothetical protein Rumeso_02924 [Rubellimicrobium mesophilum DSM 19309]|uniref:Uncharacterized protein n=1 Tax=Rubellimicrobium mesophilum DSM 19309 TaxID=442562 RepID=A0A017HP19_9RHOB|nr:hypothetical protein [Rubellimicrobium mesophilum]EYD75514.1 hypothetical protein Rumeso_02924 [Rubellimicrobium mesophilum DSM 19309]
MNRSRTWAILIGVLAVLFLIFVFFRTGGREQAPEVATPTAEEGQTAAPTSTEPAAEGQ